MLYDWERILMITNTSIQVIAFFIGTAWAIFQFFKYRQHSPKLDVQHSIDIIKHEKEAVYLRIKITIKNVGQVLIKNVEGNSSICDFSNLSEDDITHLNQHRLPIKICLFDLKFSEFDYEPELIEPGEKDAITKVIIIENSPSVIELYSHIVNLYYKPRGRLFKSNETSTIGWTNSTIHKIESK